MTSYRKVLPATDSPRDAVAAHVENGIRSIVAMFNKPILVNRTKEHDKKIERAIRGVFDVYADLACAALLDELEAEFVGIDMTATPATQRVKDFIDAKREAKS